VIVAESVIVVCDVCGDPAEERVMIRARGQNYAKDLCGKHVSELLVGTSTPRRGRPRLGAKQSGGAKTTSSAKTKTKGTSRRRRRTRAKAAA
jgi:hypothetical protein